MAEQAKTMMEEYAKTTTEQAKVVMEEQAKTTIKQAKTVVEGIKQQSQSQVKILKAILGIVGQQRQEVVVSSGGSTPRIFMK